MPKKSGEKEEGRKCVIGFKRAFTSWDHLLYGAVFDKLMPCCDSFRKWFEITGHRKRNSFDIPSERESNGFNLVTRGGRFVLVNRIVMSSHNLFEDEVKFCQSCGASVEVKCTKSVELKPRKKEIPDGYDEEIKWQEGEQAP